MALIRYSIESDKVSEIPVKYSYLAQIADCRIISIVKKEVRIEMGFLVLSILYMQISKRKELLHQIEKLLITQEEYLFNNPHCDGRTFYLCRAAAAFLNAQHQPVFFFAPSSM